MFEFFLCTFLAILLSVILMFYYTVVHAQDTVWRRNQSNELTEAMDKIRSMESELVSKIKELDELREKLQRGSHRSRKTLDMERLATSESHDNTDCAPSPPSPDILITDTGALYDTSPYPEATIKKNREEIAAARRRSSLMSHGSSRHSSNASVQSLTRFLISGKGSRQEAQQAVQNFVCFDENLWALENSTCGNEELIAATTRRRSSCWSQSSSRRGSYSADQMVLMSGDTELVTLRPPEAGQGHTGDRRVSWPRVGARRRHSTFPPENMNKILET